MGLENSYGHPRLNGKRLIILQVHKRIDDSVIRFPVASAFSDPAVDHQPFRLLGIFHIVLQHTQQNFLFPPPATQLRAPLRFHRIEYFVFHRISFLSLTDSKPDSSLMWAGCPPTRHQHA